MERLPIVVYGATGFTGRLICRCLVRDQVEFAVAGRDVAKLEALAKQLGPGIPVIIAPLDDAARLGAMAARGRVVLDCAGPFARFGRPVQDAALAAGTHFLDISGETEYILAGASRDGEARAAKVALVSALGTADGLVALAGEAADTRGSQSSSLRIAVVTSGERLSQGTMRSIMAFADRGGQAFVDGEYRDDPFGAATWDVPFPAPFGLRRCRSVPFGDLGSAPRTSGARIVRTYYALGPVAGRMLPAMRPLTSLLAWRPVEKISQSVIARLPEGPSEAERARAEFAIYVESSGAKGRARAWLAGPSMYDFTAEIAAWCARRAAQPDFSAVGALTPSQAFGGRAMINALSARGLRWSLVPP